MAARENGSARHDSSRGSPARIHVLAETLQHIPSNFRIVQGSPVRPSMSSAGEDNTMIELRKASFRLQSRRAGRAEGGVRASPAMARCPPRTRRKNLRRTDAAIELRDGRRAPTRQTVGSAIPPSQGPLRNCPRLRPPARPQKGIENYLPCRMASAAGQESQALNLRSVWGLFDKTNRSPMLCFQQLPGFVSAKNIFSEAHFGFAFARRAS